jgi:1,4-alpha-glucan branching enzyme
LFLHAHLPFVRHPGYAEFLEEEWLYEAITETYIPLLQLLEGWADDGVRARITLSLSPPLIEMLRDELLMRNYSWRIRRLVDLAESEVRRNVHNEYYLANSEMYRDRFADTLDRFEGRYSRDLVAAFAAMEQAGVVELITCNATHAFLPCLMAGGADHARTQIRLGLQCFQKHFGKRPAGMWLAECGFVPGLDRMLADEGVEYILVDSHGVEFADPAPVFSTYSPIVSPSGVFAFPRDRESSAQVWSKDWGYPGDARYREFYRDLGYDHDDPALDAFRLPDGGRKNVGIKYHRITGKDVPLDQKHTYHRGWALEAAAEHSDNFFSGRVKQFEYWSTMFGRPAVVVAPYDAELFGHWWFEGMEFLDGFVRKSALNPVAFLLSTPTDVMNSLPGFQVSMPASSSWGAYGYSDTWLNPSNEWVWKPLHQAATQMAAIAAERSGAKQLELRALNQLARELVLASSSDWPFILTMGTTVPYAHRRIQEHLNRFHRLLGSIRAQNIDAEWLGRIEAQDNIFPYIDFRDFAAPGERVGPPLQRPSAVAATYCP